MSMKPRKSVYANFNIGIALSGPSLPLKVTALIATISTRIRASESENSREIKQDSLFPGACSRAILTVIPLNCRDRRKGTVRTTEEAPGVSRKRRQRDAMAVAPGRATWPRERSVSREPTWLLLILSFFNSIPPPAPSFFPSLSLSLSLSSSSSRLICTSREVWLIEEASGGFFLLSYREIQPDSAISVLAAHRFHIYLAELYRYVYYVHYITHIWWKRTSQDWGEESRCLR